jgi:hydroxymethylbilane synthase
MSRKHVSQFHSYFGLIKSDRVADTKNNRDTRLAKLDAEDGPYTCIFLASAGLRRMNKESRITATLPPQIFQHAVGQGALGVEIRANDPVALKLVGALNHPPTRYRCLAERSLLRTLQGGCSAPIGANTVFRDDILNLSGCFIHPDGGVEYRAHAALKVTSDEEAERLGVIVAQSLIKKGAGSLLAAVQQHRVT